MYARRAWASAKPGIQRDGFLVHGISRQIVGFLQRIDRLVRLILGLEELIVGRRVLRRRRGQRGGLVWRQLRLEHVGDLLRHLAFDRKHVLQFAIESLRPQMRVVARVDQLHIDAHGVAGFLHAAFEHVRHTQFAGDYLQVVRLAFVTLGRSARDHLQIANAGQAGEDLVLDAFGKISVVGIATQVVERQHRDRFVRDGIICRRRLACTGIMRRPARTLRDVPQPGTTDRQQQREDQ